MVPDLEPGLGAGLEDKAERRSDMAAKKKATKKKATKKKAKK